MKLVIYSKNRIPCNLIAVITVPPIAVKSSVGASLAWVHRYLGSGDTKGCDNWPSCVEFAYAVNADNSADLSWGLPGDQNIDATLDCVSSVFLNSTSSQGQKVMSCQASKILLLSSMLPRCSFSGNSNISMTVLTFRCALNWENSVAIISVPIHWEKKDETIENEVTPVKTMIFGISRMNHRRSREFFQKNYALNKF